MSSFEGDENAPEFEHAIRSPLKDLNIHTPAGRRGSTGDTSLVKRFAIRSADQENSNHAALNAQREVKRLKAQVLEKDRQLSQLDRQLCVTRGQLEELQQQEQRHRNASKEIKKQLSAQETTTRAKSAALARVSGQLQRITEMEASRSRRKTLQIKELNAEFEKMEESYCGQLCALEEELSCARASLEDMAELDQLRAEADRLRESAGGMSTLLKSTEEQLARTEREKHHAVCLHQMRMLAVQRQFEALFETVASETQREMGGLLDMQMSVREEQERQSLQFAQLYHAFEEQREEKIDAQLRVVSLVTDLGLARTASAEAREEVSRLGVELSVAQELTEEVTRSLLHTASLLREKIASLEDTVVKLELELRAGQSASAEAISAVEGERDRLLADYEHRLSEKDGELQLLTHDMSSASATHAADVAKLHAINCALSEEYSSARESLESELQSLSLQWEDVKRHLDEEKIRYTEAMASAQRSHSELVTQWASQKAEHVATVQCFQDSIDELSACINREAARASALEAQLSKETAAHADAVHSLKKIRIDADASHAEELRKMAGLHEVVVATQRQLEADRAREKAVCSGVIKALKASNAELTTKLDIEIEKHKSTTCNLASSAAALFTAEHRAEDLDSELNSLRKAIAQMVEDHQGENASYEKMLGAFNETTNELKQQLSLQMVEHSEAIASLRASYDELSSQHSMDISSLAKSHEIDLQRSDSMNISLTQEADQLRLCLKQQQLANQKALEELQADFDQIRSYRSAEWAEMSRLREHSSELGADAELLKQQLDVIGAELAIERTLRAEAVAAHESERAHLEGLLIEVQSSRRADRNAHEQVVECLRIQIETERREHEKASNDSSTIQTKEEVEALAREMERYKGLYTKAIQENSVFMGHANNSQKIRYVMELKQQVNALLEENHALTLKTVGAGKRY